MDTVIVDSKPSIKRKVILGGSIAVLVLIIIIVAGFFICEHYYGSHFLKGTVVNGINVSGMSIDELNSEINDYELIISERDSEGNKTEEVLKGSDVGLKLISDGELYDILESQEGGKWLFGKGKEYQLDELTEYDMGKWEKVVKALQCFDEDFVIAPEDAYVPVYDEDKGEFELIAEIEGNTLDVSKAERVLADAVRVLDSTLDFESEECYEEPKIRTTDDKLKEFYDTLCKYQNVNITYTFGEKKEELLGSDICKWLIVGYDDYTVSVDPERVSTYVAYLKWNYDSIFTTRTFMTSYGQEVTIEGGDYGWWMNKDEEVAGLTAMIEAGESGDRTPVYYQEAAAYGDNDIGDTYVEINLTSQHLFLYVDGQKILESDFVSGKPSTGHATPAGTYAVTYTQRYATLNGENYSTPVSYWMPFNEDIGMHDAVWKSEFGSNFYTSAGSHGCINLPYPVAKEIYSYVYKGMAIVCYHMPGTESASVTLQSDEEKAMAAIDAINGIASASNKKKQAANARAVYNDLRTGAVKALVTNYNILTEFEATN